MEEATKPPARESPRRAARGNEKRLSLHPMTLEEAVDRLLQLKPGECVAGAPRGAQARALTTTRGRWTASPQPRVSVRVPALLSDA